ncbi:MULTISPECIES: ring-cleaving dioxygenase [unclassified Paenibacillus]|uniref:ring-cleaving dioxygenase n=1 Tax=unclassified Paenibacillus TaxID=185978 RepID=UPI002405D405|nr:MULTISPECIES: ring-cleaving dioxygenase [unclassified Paenibacillus]MDF9839975.1 glyoxalase family protein [Paenibacillus sp. PastF-2]MDF9846557.1 glyoxalase family protein [Paenibacillus sp. PastM-2]MDF9853095.1 glyoxalase family protein [Paenibacillus sp. PastF-1]MDH6478401.1 glyoxalase family protein [Paenibacillus sp. PastH-2]MDH6506101.1 glyoxalase family protein [Paenibacillus sp. PastM-3]
MTLQTAGIHHITAFVRDAQQNADFYAGILGLRLVKKTINFDAPEVYHLYFGDEQGSPGTIITFFPWATGRKGRIGGGQVGVTTYAVPAGSLGFWEQRLANYRIPVTKVTRIGEAYLSFADYDGLRIELVEREAGALSTWSFGGVSAEHAIKGFGGAVLYSMNPDKTADTLTRTLGLEQIAEGDGYIRYRSSADIGNIIDLKTTPVPQGGGGTGTVHHIAWRAKDDAEQLQWGRTVQSHGYQPTPVQDRQYFNAIYFREEGGILFEIATDPPGFARDEEPDKLGQKLMLPVWFEPNRAVIEANLSPFEIREVEANRV